MNVPIVECYNWIVQSVNQSKGGGIISNTKHIKDVFRNYLTVKYYNIELQLYKQP
jgi:hypothetical protein